MALAVVPLTPRVTVRVHGPVPLTFETVICSFSIWIVSPAVTAETPPVFVTVIVRFGYVTFKTLSPEVCTALPWRRGRA